MNTEDCQIMSEEEKLSRLHQWFDDFLGEPSAYQCPVDSEKFPCGTVYKHYFDPLTGFRKSFPLFCNDQWACDGCHDRRKHGLQQRMLRAVMTAVIAVIPLEDPQADDLIAMLNKDQYLRLPAFKVPAKRDDKYKGTGALFFVRTDEAETLLAGNKAVQFIDDPYEVPEGFPYTWDELTNTPDGKRPSGSLGREPEKESKGDGADEEEEVKVDVPILSIEKQNEGVIESIMMQAVFETKDLDPQTTEELEAALEERTDKAVELLKARGIAVLHRGTMSRNIKISVMSWTLKERPPRPPSPTQLKLAELPPEIGNP